MTGDSREDILILLDAIEELLDQVRHSLKSEQGDNNADGR